MKLPQLIKVIFSPEDNVVASAPSMYTLEDLQTFFLPISAFLKREMGSFKNTQIKIDLKIHRHKISLSYRGTALCYFGKYKITVHIIIYNCSPKANRILLNVCLGDYSIIFSKLEANNCFSIITQVII